MFAAWDPQGRGRPSVTVRGSSFVRNRLAAIGLGGADASIEATVVRDMLPNADLMKGGRGVQVQSNPFDPRQRGKLNLRVHRAMDIGVMATSSDTTVERTLVRATQPRALDALFGDGLAIASGNGLGTANVTASRFEGQPQLHRPRRWRVRRSTH